MLSCDRGFESTDLEHVQVFYYSHVIGGVLIVVFMTLHVNVSGCYVYGVAIWGIDIVYRMAQAYYPVDIEARVGFGKTIVTLIIPVAVRSDTLLVSLAAIFWSGWYSGNKAWPIHLLCVPEHCTFVCITSKM